MSTYDAYVDLQWSIGTSGGFITSPIGASAGNQVATWRGLYQPDTPTTASPLGEYGVADPATVNGFIPDMTPLADFNGCLVLWSGGDYYYRIWVFPMTLRVQNPQLNVPIPFHIWNAFPWHNTLETITEVDTDGLTLSVTPPSIFKEIEYRQVDITIGPDAPINVSATYHFFFDYGDSLFYFQAVIADFVQMIPDPPVTETWDWLTDIMISYNGEEQRVALRAAPRRGLTYSFLLESDAERRRQYNRWYKSLPVSIVLPYYQYATELLQSAAIGDTKLYLDTSLSDFRDGDYAILLDGHDESAFLVKIETVDTDGLTLTSPLVQAARSGLVVSPAFTSRLFDNTGLSMTKVTGKITVQSEVLTARAQFSRPGSTAAITSFDGYIVLNRRPLANADVTEIFSSGYEIIDSESGVEDIKHSWEHTFVSGTRQFLIQRRLQPVEMDYWRDLMSQLFGQQTPFLMPTWRSDLPLHEQPEIGSSQLIVDAADYTSLYYPANTYRRLQIETDEGIIWRKVISSTDQPDGTTLLELDTNFGVTEAGSTINKISFLNVTRLNSDRVTLYHDHLSTVIEINIRTIDA
jgi:hypothetical protein